MPAIITTLLISGAMLMNWRYFKQEYAEDALRRSLADATQHWLIAEAPSPVGFAKYSYQQRMADDGQDWYAAA